VETLLSYLVMDGVLGNMDDAARGAVVRALNEMAVQEGVSVLFAAEKSSRIFGSHHKDSDCDVVAIFAWPRARYFSMRLVPTALKFKLDQTACHPEIDIQGLEIRHAFSLFADNNPSLLEVFRSPLVYYERQPSTSLSVARVGGAQCIRSDPGSDVVGDIRTTMARLYEHVSLVRSWFNHAKGNYCSYIKPKKLAQLEADCPPTQEAAHSSRHPKDDGAATFSADGLVGHRTGAQAGLIVRKKYLHVLRYLLSIEWVREHTSSLDFLGVVDCVSCSEDNVTANTSSSSSSSDEKPAAAAVNIVSVVVAGEPEPALDNTQLMAQPRPLSPTTPIPPALPLPPSTPTAAPAPTPAAEKSVEKEEGGKDEGEDGGGREGSSNRRDSSSSFTQQAAVLLDSSFPPLRLQELIAEVSFVPCAVRSLVLDDLLVHGNRPSLALRLPRILLLDEFLAQLLRRSEVLCRALGKADKGASAHDQTKKKKNSEKRSEKKKEESKEIGGVAVAAAAIAGGRGRVDGSGGGGADNGEDGGTAKAVGMGKGTLQAQREARIEEWDLLLVRVLEETTAA
jgi:predicted nucleotidyltransferase